MIQTAQSYLTAGLCALAADSKTKYPITQVGKWGRFKDRLPTDTEMSAWFANHPDGLCIVCGETSGNLEVLDFDACGEKFPAWEEAIPRELFERLVIEQTPSGGFHVLYRCEESICGSLKLAMRKQPVAETDIYLDEKDREMTRVYGKEFQVMRNEDGSAYVNVTLIETKGKGGVIMCAPTPGYELIQGDICDLPVLTSADRAILLQTAFDLDECPKDNADNGDGGQDNADNRPWSADNAHNRDYGADNAHMPGSDYNVRGDVRSLLQSHGWVRIKGGENEYWRRPGKDKGNSATFDGTCFYVFSPNAAPFEMEKGYSPFSVYIMLEHNGDDKAAARALSAQGYGCGPEVDPSVDISAIVGGSANCPADNAENVECGEDTADNSDCADHIADPGPIPEHMFNVPGFIGEVMDFCLATAPYPNRGLAFCGALALLSFLCGRKVTEPGDLRPNLYLLALAGSGAGKDHPRKINARVLVEAGLIHCLGDKFASGEGIQDAMAHSPCMLYQNDEMDSVLRQINRDRDGTRESIPATLLTMYTSAGSVYPMRVKAGESAGVIDQPSMTLLGTATPKYFYESLSERMLTNGFFARLIIIDVGRRGRGQRPQSIRHLPERIAETAQWWAKYNPGQGGNLRHFHPEPHVVPIDPDAATLLDDFRIATEREYRTGETSTNEVAMAVWARGYENASKLALLYACSENHENPKITIPAVEWSIRFADHQIRRQLCLAGEHVYRTEFEDHCKQLLRVLREWHTEKGDEWMPYWRVSRKLKWTPRLHDDVRIALENSREIEYEEKITPGRRARRYRLLTRSCTKAPSNPGNSPCDQDAAGGNTGKKCKKDAKGQGGKPYE